MSFSKYRSGPTWGVRILAIILKKQIRQRGDMKYPKIPKAFNLSVFSILKLVTCFLFETSGRVSLFDSEIGKMSFNFSSIKSEIFGIKST